MLVLYFSSFILILEMGLSMTLDFLNIAAKEKTLLQDYK